MNYSYEITSRSAELGGGWRLRLLKDNVEVGGDVFPPKCEKQDAIKQAFEAAESKACAWLDSRKT